MRRRPGLAGIGHRKDTTTQMRSVGEVAEKERIDSLREQLVHFRTSLEEFALKYKADIRRCALSVHAVSRVSSTPPCRAHRPTPVISNAKKKQDGKKRSFLPSLRIGSSAPTTLSPPDD